MKFYQQFKWAVPDAFTEALADCFFVKGDTLYDDKRAYLPWDTKNLNFSIQVQMPERNKIIDTAFYQNWFSSALLLLVDYKNNFSKTYIESTQGRLFTLLWKGDLRVLNLEVPEPQPPLLVKELKAFLKRDLKIPASKDEVIFGMPYDPTNAVAQEKKKILDVLLKNNFQFDIFDVYPSKANISECTVFSFAPTVCFKCYRIKSIDMIKISEILKNALYRPQNGKDTGRFNIERHGVLICPIFAS